MSDYPRNPVFADNSVLRDIPLTPDQLELGVAIIVIDSIYNRYEEYKVVGKVHQHEDGQYVTLQSATSSLKGGSTKLFWIGIAPQYPVPGKEGIWSMIYYTVSKFDFVEQELETVLGLQQGSGDHEEQPAWI